MLLRGLHTSEAEIVSVVIGRIVYWFKYCGFALLTSLLVALLGGFLLMELENRPNTAASMEARLNDLWESNQAMQSQLNRIEQTIARQQATSPTVRQREIAKRFEKFSKQR